LIGKAMLATTAGLPAGFDTYYEANATTASGASFIVQKKFYTCWGKETQQAGTVSATAAANTARPGPGNATTADDKTTATSAPVAGPTANAAPNATKIPAVAAATTTSAAADSTSALVAGPTNNTTSPDSEIPAAAAATATWAAATAATAATVVLLTT